MIKIANQEISETSPPYIVAEMSGNHNQDFNRACKIIEKAKECGASAIKFQSATPEGLTIDHSSEDFIINDKNSLWHGKQLFELYKSAVTPWEWHKDLFDYSKEIGIDCFSSPFELNAIDLLEQLDTPCYKIASFELNDHELVAAAASTKKPIILSTGMASIADIEETVNLCQKNGNDNIVILRCTSSYPATAKDSNLASIPELKKIFGKEIGLSDHTLGIGAACAAVALGATFVEKHFTLSRHDGGVDSEFSADPDEMKMLVSECRNSWLSIGEVKFGKVESEKESIKFRRSLYVVEDVKKGESFNENNLRIIRPGYGEQPKFYRLILGKKANSDIKKGTPMDWKYVG